MAEDAQLVRDALATSTPRDAQLIQTRLASALAGRHERPLGDRWNNHGLMGQAGSFDLKLIEQLTNMQDAVLERHALLQYGSSPVPYTSPHQAAEDLFTAMSDTERAELALVRFVESDGNPVKAKRLTAIFRDKGCGLTPRSVPTTIFQLGGRLKEDRLWQQGAFGLGGATTYRNAEAAVLVTRRDPALLAQGEEDRITVAVVEWKAMTKGRGAYYLVDQEWTKSGDEGAPWSCPACLVHDFEPGTHLALISYGVDGIQRQREGDEKSFDTIANTRLFRPVMPITFRNETTRSRNTRLSGLGKRLATDRDEVIPTETLLVPFGLGGRTYELPITYHLFNKRGEPGERRKFVAHDHVVVFTSNGQVHHHWKRDEFKARTRLKQLVDRVFVVVETDALPIDVRTNLFTADRASLVRTDAAVRLEETIAGALNGWDALTEENNRLIREALRGGDQPRLEIARKISRMLDARGFRPGGSDGTGGGTGGQGGGGGSERGARKKVDLHVDPTYIDGPATRKVEIGKTAFMTFYIDVVDDFWNQDRGRLKIDTDHAEIGSDEIRAGKGRNGRVRVSVAIPESAEPGTEELRVTLADWHRASGGLGPTLTHTCKLELVTELFGSGSGAGKSGAGNKGNKGASIGNFVALEWANPDARPEWGKMTVGEVAELPASQLAADVPAYSELASLGDKLIPVIFLNEEYPSFKQYLSNRTTQLTDLNRPKEQYAVGVGVGLVLLDQEVQRREQKGEIVDEDWIHRSHQAAAHAVLAVMPAADELAREAGFDDSA